MTDAARSALRELLQTLPYFKGLPDEQLHWLTAQCHHYTFATNENVFLTGEASTGMWLVESGRTKVFAINPDGEEHILRLFGPGDTFNDIPAFDGGPNAANASALITTSLWLIPSAALLHLLTTNNDMALRVVKMMARQVRVLVGQVENLALYSVTVRLARFLLEQAENPSLSGPGVTRANIAAHLATTPETVSRALRTLEKTQAIRFDRQHIIIEREDALRTIAAL